MNDKHEDCDYCPTKQAIAVTDQVLDLANEIFVYVMNELKENREDWYYEFQKMTEQEQAALFIALADAFSDTTDD